MLTSLMTSAGAATWGSRSAAFAAAAAAAEGTAVQLDGTPEFNRPAGAWPVA